LELRALYIIKLKINVKKTAANQFQLSINLSSCDDEMGGVNGYFDPHPPLGIYVEETLWGKLIFSPSFKITSYLQLHSRVFFSQRPLATNGLANWHVAGYHLAQKENFSQILHFAPTL
jgi:hypothetical protein